MKTRKFECPFCDYPVELPEENAKGEIHCPSCSRFFDPAVFTGPVPAAPMKKRTTQELAAEFEKQDRKDERAAIRQQAAIVTLVAILLAAVGGCFLFAALRDCATLEPYLNPLVIGACLLMCAIGLYLVAQVIHIRANTHR